MFDVDFQDDGGIDLLIYYAPPGSRMGTDRNAGESSKKQRDRATEGAWICHAPSIRYTYCYLRGL